MMKNPHPAHNRMTALSVALGLIMLLFIAALYSAQILNGSENRARSIASNATWQSVEASRGILTDRNGKVLVSNRLAYTLTFSKKSFSDEQELNAAIWRLVELCRQTETAWVDTLPLSQNAPYLYLASRKDDAFQSFLKNNKIEATITSTALMDTLREMYHIDSSYSAVQARLIAGVRYELTGRDSYVFAEDVSTELISQITDGNFAGVTTGQSSIRQYNTTYAAHILGRITRIYAEDWPEYQAKGYSMDALVGESGVERAFEDWLHGNNGTRLVTTDEKGKITGEFYVKEPKPGGTVALTLDLDLQTATEDALANTIEGMIDKDSDQRGGAAAVVKVGSGEVLALASYPSFDLSTFAQSYNDLLEDERLPMFNRAVNGDGDVDFDDKTVVLLNDIDLAGLEWTPLDGERIPYITFDGQGHTIRNMTINYGLNRDVGEPYVGAGFVGTVPASAEITFKNITFEDTKIVARERHVGCLVGRSLGGACTFENVTVRNFTVDGWCDYNNTSADTDGYPIAFRVAGIMGASWGGDHIFTNVTVQNINISGFHNLAGILGYDASGLISEYSFENCKVEGATMVFSYCLSPNYTTDMPRRFVSVFYNGPKWVDNIDACVEQGNTFSGVSFYDWTSTEEVDEYGNKKVSAMTEFSPDNFRSWTQEEADA